MRIGVDVGGTFTDCVVLHRDGSRTTSKVPTTPANPAAGILAAVHAVAQTAGFETHELLSRTESFVHGCTIATNTMVERNGAQTALLTTRGHEDAIRIGRGRQQIAGLSEAEVTHVTRHRKPRPLVASRHVRGLTERVDADGDIIVPLDPTEVATAVDELLADGIEAFAVCLLWSFKNAAHEQVVEQILAARAQTAYVSVSHQVAPLLGEYERAASTVINSYVGPRVVAYIGALETDLARLGLGTPILFTQASGGLATAEAVRQRPLLTLDSGPAAGILGVASLAGLLGEQDLLCADVGGTTFDVGVISRGRPELEEYPVIEQYELRLPKIMVKSIGSGGGSVAWADDRGNLRVGPQSAGAEPGPACYGRGGTAPTLTDAYLLLGYLDEDLPLAGGLRLDRRAAEAAMARLATTLDWSAEQTAAGVMRIAHNHMADLLHRVTLERGLDPRRFALVAYGGAGPIAAAALGAAVGARSVRIMPEAGEFSALGMLTTGLVWWAQHAISLRLPLREGDVRSLNEHLDGLRVEVLAFFIQQGRSSAEVELNASCDMRFAMQAHHLEVELPADRLPAEPSSFLRAAFADRYTAVYSPNSIYARAEVEIVNVRMVGRTRSDPSSVQPTVQPAAVIREMGSRDVYFDGCGWVPSRVLFAEHLPAPAHFSGPAIIHRSGDTVAIPPAWSASVDQAGQLMLTPD